MQRLLAALTLAKPIAMHNSQLLMIAAPHLIATDPWRHTLAMGQL